MKNYLIIGASSGIGKSLAQLLLDSGNNVIGTYNETSPENITGLEYHFLNVQDENWDLSFIPDDIDGIAYCPGAIDLKPFQRIKPADFIEDYELQVVGAIKVLQKVLPNLKAGDGGSVVLFSTVAVQNGFPFHAKVAASKGAIEGLTKALAAEWAPKIRVNCIAPSLTDTPLASRLLSSDEKKEVNAQRHPLKRIGEAEDIAEAAKYLLTSQSSWVTGQVMAVDGGMSSLKI